MAFDGWNYYVAYVGNNKHRLDETEKAAKAFDNFVVIVRTTDVKEEFIERGISADTYKYMHDIGKYDFVEKAKRIASYATYVKFAAWPNWLLEGYNQINPAMQFTHYENTIMERITFKYTTNIGNTLGQVAYSLADLRPAMTSYFGYKALRPSRRILCYLSA